MSSSETRLAVYGSLAPGCPNEAQLAELPGTWTHGTVTGELKDDGWGAAIGYPGIILDPAGPEVRVQVFESPDLPRHWQRLDDFEGPGYRRVVTTVRTDAGEIEAHIYVVAGN